MPRGASGSSQIKAKDLVAFGGSDQCRGGDVSAPSPVCCFGMVEPSVKAVLVRLIDIAGSPDGDLVARPTDTADVNLPPILYDDDDGDQDKVGQRCSNLDRNDGSAARPALPCLRSCSRLQYPIPRRKGMGIVVWCEAPIRFKRLNRHIARQHFAFDSQYEWRPRWQAIFKHSLKPQARFLLVNVNIINVPVLL